MISQGVFFLNQKSAVFDCFVELLMQASNDSGCKLKVFRTDNGTSFYSLQFSNYLDFKSVHLLRIHLHHTILV
uniref:Integrase catalytic domain-containing protein n=1 Tax=Utricularia reniformis TaxID=192314 RepID=A0A1Y0B3K3_9LAMI|nr:hypothetical protein AEK19_MT1809 [Utricularia reniformis]ART31980.1 hypothetical protein AEK19_MT1809 [Utricularia reniformis]